MWLVVTLAFAQSPIAPVPPEQAELYVAANAAYEGGQHEVALELLGRAESYGPLNLIHLARGRVYQRLDQCAEADREYLLALTAPAVPSPTAQAVASRVAVYRDELAKGCPGTLRVACTPPDLPLEVDGTARPCGSDLSVAPGPHHLEAALGRARVEQDVVVRGLETVEVPLHLAVPARRTGFAVSLGAGAALLAAGLVVDVVALGPAQDRADAAALARSGESCGPGGAVASRAALCAGSRLRSARVRPRRRWRSG
ncbi:MAG: hypothetical protein ABMA64_18845, partial [Myxococcota bacterium]